MHILVVDIGGTNVKMLASGQEVPRKFPSPVYSAVMVCVPWDRAEVVKLPTPPGLPRLAGEPSGRPSHLNWTVPLGIPLPGATADSVAAKVRFEPVGDGLAEEVTLLSTEAGVMAKVPSANTKS